MIIENRKKARQIKMVFLFVPLLFTVVLLAMVLMELSWGFWVVMGVAILMVLLFIVMMLMQYNYFFCEINNDKLIFKFHGLAPLNKEYKTYKIKTQNFKSFNINSSMFGLIKKLTIFIVVEKNKIAKYPPVSISALSSEQEKQLVNALASLEKVRK